MGKSNFSPHTISIKKHTKKARTSKQSRSLHLWFTSLAEMLNDAGYKQKSLMADMKEGFDIPITDSMLKEIFKKIAMAMYEKDSTTKLTTKELQEVYKIMDFRLREITGVGCEFPSIQPPDYPGEEK